MNNRETGQPSRPRPFQFRLRTLFLFGVIVALYGSLANSLEGFIRLGAILSLTTLLLGVLYWKGRLYAALTIVCAGPMLTAVLWIAAAMPGHGPDGWPAFLFVGNAVGIAYSLVYAAVESRRR